MYLLREKPPNKWPNQCFVKTNTQLFNENKGAETRTTLYSFQIKLPKVNNRIIGQSGHTGRQSGLVALLSNFFTTRECQQEMAALEEGLVQRLNFLGEEDPVLKSIWRNSSGRNLRIKFTI
jgi:hypothetical protein